MNMIFFKKQNWYLKLYYSYKVIFTIPASGLSSVLTWWKIRVKFWEYSALGQKHSKWHIFTKTALNFKSQGANRMYSSCSFQPYPTLVQIQCTSRDMARNVFLAYLYTVSHGHSSPAWFQRLYRRVPKYTSDTVEKDCHNSHSLARLGCTDKPFFPHTKPSVI